MKRLLLSTVITLGLLLSASLSLAAADVSKLQLAGDMTQVQAEKIIKAALVKAVAQGVPMNIAVVDAGGNLKAFVRQDGAFIGSVDLAIKKAVTARYFNMTTATLGAAAQPGKSLYGIEVSNQGLVVFGGGYPVTDKNGVIIGAIGVSGGSVEEDCKVAEAALTAMK